MEEKLALYPDISCFKKELREQSGKSHSLTEEVFFPFHPRLWSI